MSLWGDRVNSCDICGWTAAGMCFLYPPRSGSQTDRRAREDAGLTGKQQLHREPRLRYGASWGQSRNRCPLQTGSARPGVRGGKGQGARPAACVASLRCSFEVWVGERPQGPGGPAGLSAPLDAEQPRVPVFPSPFTQRRNEKARDSLSSWVFLSSPRDIIN